MFKGILSHTGAEGRTARRLATVAQSARRSHQPHLRETARQSMQQLNSVRAREQSRRAHRHNRSQQHVFERQISGEIDAATQAGWTAAQDAALAQEDATWRARNPRHSFQQEDAAPASFTGSSFSPLHYDAVDAETGNSVVQQNFDQLVHRALLHYGPPLPVEVVMNNKVISAAAMSPAQRRAQHAELQHGGTGGADDPSAVYMDEVGLKMHEFMAVLRKEEPHFSVRESCDGVPLSLMVQNCSLLRAYGGKVNYMRFVRRLPRASSDDVRGSTPAPSSPSDDKEGPADAGDTMIVSLGMYKMREMPSQDGVRQGPQPWRYSYRTL